jgi:Xaa-Pro aminopeptidase
LNRAERLARLLRVLAAIIAEPGLNPLELADRAGVSERTLRRDLAQLRELGYEVAYTSGYEVQEKLNLEGRTKKAPRPRADDALLQAVAHAVETAGLWRDSDGKSAAQPRRRTSVALARRPIVLIPSGHDDADFVYAAGLPIESALYVRFAAGDDVLVASPLEIDRARAAGKASRVLSFAEAGFEEAGAYRSWPRLAAKLLRERGLSDVRVSPRLAAGYAEGLREAGLEVAIDPELFVAERRKKGAAEAEAIREAQRAAEAAVREVVGHLAAAEIRDGVLWRDGQPLTSEWLYARASFRLGELGYTCPDMIIAGSPECAMPHFRGAGQIRAGAPVIIDIFPTGRDSHFNGDLTRTVVVGGASEEVIRMHAATLQALDASIESIAAGVPAAEVHNTACQVLVDRGFGTVWPGYEGPDGVAKMNHSLGHGVGLEVHEEPGVRRANREPLAAGDVITVEPGLYLLGLGGVRIEDTGMVTASGFENFTTLTRSLDPKDYLES